MIRAEPRMGTNLVKVTFTLPLDDVVGAMAVVGDFNDWDPTATLLAGADGMCRASAVMNAGRRYAFRYLSEGGRWFNDHTADDYQPNEFGGSDSVVDLSGRPAPG